MDNEEATVAEIEMFTDCSRAIVNTLVKNGVYGIINANEPVYEEKPQNVSFRQDPNYEKIPNWPRQLRMVYNALGEKDKAAEISKMLGDE